MTAEQKEELREAVIKIVDIFVEVSRFSLVKHLQKKQKKLEPDFVSYTFVTMKRMVVIFEQFALFAGKMLLAIRTLAWEILYMIISGNPSILS